MIRDRDVSHWSGVTAFCVGAGALAGWVLDIGVLKSILPGWVEMKANTAVAFVLMGVALLTLAPPRSSGRSRISTSLSLFGRACGLCVGLVGLLSLSEYVFGWNPGFDQWLFVEPAGAVGTTNPGRMAPDTALCFALLAVALELLRRPRSSKVSLVAAASFGAVVTAVAASAILLYATPALGSFGWWGLTMMAAPTAALFATIGASVTLRAWQDEVSIWSLGRTPSIAFLGGLALLLFIGLNTSRSIARLSEADRFVTNVAEFHQTTTLAMAELAHAQTHTRGYVITGEARYLRSQRAAIECCRAALAELRQLVAGNPREEEYCFLLEVRANEAIEWFSRAGALERTNLSDEARRELVEQGEDRMESLRLMVARRELEDRRMLQLHRLEAARASRLAHVVSFAGTAVGVIVFLSVLFALNRAFEERKRAEIALEQLNATLEEQIAQRTAQLEATNRELQAFSYSVSHDLRAPLRGIDGGSHALLEDFGDRLGEEARNYLDRIRSEIQRMGALIDDLLALSRLTVAALHKDYVDLSAMARTIADRLSDREPQRRVEFVIEDGLIAFCHRHFLDAALGNLLENAFKFTGKTPNARIEFGKIEAPGKRSFFVRDNGAGFDMAHATRLFSAFHRMHKSSEFPGTGVGLATVERVVQRHGGCVWAEAAPDCGATFYFTLEENQ